MNKLQKQLQQIGIHYKKENGLAKNDVLWIELLNGNTVTDSYIGSAYNIYCRASGKTATGINMYVFQDGGRSGYGFDKSTKQTVHFSDLGVDNSTKLS